VPPAGNTHDLLLHADRRGQTGKEKSTGFENPPGSPYHRRKLFVVSREVEHRTAEHDVGKGIRKRHALDGFHSEIAGRKAGRERRGGRRAASIATGSASAPNTS
jgi:hypothetical protein